MSIEDRQSRASGAVAFAPPPKVKEVAARHGLGALLGSRKLANPWSNALGWLVIALASFAVLYTFESLVPASVSGGIVRPTLRLVGFLFLAVGAFALAFAVRALITGARSYFIYTNGFLYLHNGKPATFRWSEVRALRMVRGPRGVAAAGGLRRYELDLAGGRPVGVPMRIVDGRDPFMDQLVTIVRTNGKPTP